jgi:hypothetical protein
MAGRRDELPGDEPVGGVLGGVASLTTTEWELGAGEIAVWEEGIDDEGIGSTGEGDILRGDDQICGPF